VVVNNWLKRFQAQGIEGLRTKAGRGRKPILDAESDVARVKAAVAANRRRISVAKAELEVELGKTFSTKTLERYIKNMVLAITNPKTSRQGVVPGSLRVEGRVFRRVGGAGGT
jgi:transposase